MAAWPELDELKQVLDVTSPDWDGDDGEDPTRLARLLSAAISRVKMDVGDWDEDVDSPDDALSQAALRMAELMALRPEVAPVALGDPTYARLLKGHRRVFGIA
jgi:hypothetical protein